MGIFQARILEWAAISFSRESSQPRDWTCIPFKSPALQVDSYHWAIQLLFFFNYWELIYILYQKRHSHSNHLPSLDNFYSFQKSGLSYPGSLLWFAIIQTWCLFSARKFSSNKYSTNKKQSHVIFHTLPDMSISLSMCANLRILNEWDPSFYSQDPRTWIASGQRQGFIGCVHGSRS